MALRVATLEIPSRFPAASLNLTSVNPLHLLVRLTTGICSRLRNVWFGALGVNITGYVWLRRISIPRQWSSITINAPAALDDGVVLLCSGLEKRDKLVIGAGTYINRYTVITAAEQVTIGRNCMIGPHCYIADCDHGTLPNNVVSAQPLVTRPVTIGENVWLGAGVIVLKGVSVGDGAVIGAGAVVTSAIPANSVATGVPARVSRQRG